MKEVCRQGLLLVTLLFLSGCQDAKKEGEDAVVNDDAESVTEIVEVKEVEGEPDQRMNFRDYLVAIYVQNPETKKREKYVGLGFRLSGASSQAYVAYFKEAKSRGDEIFIDGEPGSWRKTYQPWSSKKEPLLKVASLRGGSQLVFPLLEEYAQWTDGSEGARALSFEAGKLLFEAQDEEMQEIIDDEASKLAGQLQKDQKSLVDLKSTGVTRNDRLLVALQNRIQRTNSDLKRLEERAGKLGLIMPNSDRSESLSRKPVFLEKEVIPMAEDDELTGASRGMVINGGLGLLREGRLVRHLSGQEWVDLVRARLVGGKIWFHKNEEEWFPNVTMEWSGFAQKDTLKSFVIWPFQEGRPDETHPVDLGEKLAFPDFSLNRLLPLEARRFRCQLELDGGSGGTVKESFDFEVERDGGSVKPVALTSGILRAESQSRRNSSQASQASFLKELKAGGEIVQSIAYEGGSKILVRLKAPSKVRILDTLKMEWLQDFELSGAEVVTASNGDSLFVADPESHMLQRRSLEGFAVGKEVALEEGDEILAMGVGTEVKRGPLLVVYRSRMELRDPETLTVIEGVLRSPSRSNDNHLQAAITEFPNEEGEVVVYADSRGQGFSIHFFGENKEKQVLKTILAYRKSGIWYQRDEKYWKVQMRGGVLAYGSKFEEPAAGVSVRVPRSLSGSSAVFHTEGRGFMGLKINLESGVFPALPMTVIYLASPRETSQFLIIGGHAAVESFEPRGTGRRATFGRFQPFFLLPEKGRMVSLGKRRVVFEGVPLEKFSGRTVLERTPPASRRMSYHYQPKDYSGNIPDYKISKGPEGMSYDKDKGFQWEVPPNFATESAAVEVVEVGGTKETTFVIPVWGNRASGFVDLKKPAKMIPIEPVSSDPFDTPIYDVKPAANGDTLLVTHNHSRSLRVVELQTGKTLAELDSPGGPMIVFPVGKEVLICYVDGLIFERRSLPSLERKMTKVAGETGSGRLISLVVGSAKNSGQPFGLFDTGARVFDLREFDLSSFTFGPAISIPEFWVNSVSERDIKGWLKKPAVSEDGRRVWFEGRLLEQEGEGQYSYGLTVRRLSSRNKILTDRYGQFVFSEGRRFQSGLGDPWAGHDGASKLLVPGQEANWMMSLSMKSGKSGQPGSQSIDFIPFEGTEPRYRLDGLEEWEVDSVRDLQKTNPGNTRMLLCGSVPFLVTLPPDDQSLVIRKLPLEAK